MSDGQVVLPPSGKPIPFGDKEVYVGVRCDSGAPIGVPLLDVAFHPTDDSVVYVAPVLVVPPGGDAYKAAARLRLTNGPGGFVIEQTYGQEPFIGDGCCNAAPCSSSVCSVHHLREIEVYDGRVFVTSSRINGDDWLLVFDEATGIEQARIALDVPSPTAMTITSTGHLFFASAMDDQDSTSSKLYRYALGESNSVADLVLDSVILIDNMRQITSVAENPKDGSLWVLGFDAPTFNDDDIFFDNDPLFTTPMLAVVSSGATTATEITCHDLALPLSMAFNTCAASADYEPDGDIDLRDFAAFQNCFRGGSANTKACLVFDIDCDQDIDLLDQRALAQRMTGP